MKKSTFIMLKPDAKARQLEDSIIEIFKKEGFEILREGSVLVDDKLILEHYRAVIDALNLDYFEKAIQQVFVGQTVRIYEITKDCDHLIEEVRKLVGSTNPEQADPMSIRGIFKDDILNVAIAEKRMVRNLIHASDSLESAKKELALWFKEV